MSSLTKDIFWKFRPFCASNSMAWYGTSMASQHFYGIKVEKDQLLCLILYQSHVIYPWSLMQKRNAARVPVVAPTQPSWLLGCLVGWPQKAEQLQKLAAAVSGAMENSTNRTFLLVRGQPSEPVTYFNLIGLQILANFWGRVKKEVLVTDRSWWVVLPPLVRNQ